MSTLGDADYSTARSVRGLLTDGTYDAARWRMLLGVLGGVSADEVDTLQRYCNEPYTFYVFDWVKAIRRLIDHQHAMPGSDREPHLFELLSAFFTNIRPDPDGLSRLEAAVRQFSRQELEMLFGADPWLLNLAISIWEYVTGQARLSSYPWNITVPIADLCNARCTFCTSWLDGRELISLEQIDALEPVFRHAVFAGLVGHGEPLAHPKLSEIVDRLTRFLDPRASLYTITNGFLIDRLFDKLTALNLLSYSISLKIGGHWLLATDIWNANQ